MRTSARFLRVLGAAGLLISLLAALVVPVAAQEDGLPSQDGLEDLFNLNGAGFRSGDNTIYFPWVANGENFGLGDSRTSISVQNLEDRSTTIAIYVGTGDGFELETTAFLSAYASKTFSAAQLNIEEGSGAPVAVVSFQSSSADVLFPDVVAGSILTETVVLLSKPDGVGGDFTQVLACVVNASSATTNPGFGVPVGFVVAAGFTFEGVDYDAGDIFRGSFTQDDLQEILEDANDGNTGELVNPFGGLVNDGDCNDVRVAGRAGSGGTPGVVTGLDSVAIGGVAKQAVEGQNLPSTSSADTAVSGYNALNGSELERFDQHYLPIVQTNCGPGGCWNSIIRVANLNNENTAVTVRFFPHDDAQGSLDTGFQVEELVDGGETIDIDLSSLVPDGWVGSAHIFTDGRIFTMVDRYKVGYDMWITNTGSSADFEDEAQVPGANGRFALFAPHVLLDYFGWNTGINVANLVDDDNNISIQYFNLFGNATQVLNQRIAPHGMTYFYDPSQAPQDGNSQDVTSDVNAGVVGSAIIWSEHPVAAAVDATKYPESDPNGGQDVFQATSYSATQNIFTFQAVPLVQKGDPADGMGATSGINIMNPNATAATVNVFFINPSGFNAQNFGTSSVTIPGFANGFVYTMAQRNLPNGFTGSAQVVSSIPVIAVSANVDYQVDGDGSAIFNAFNPCGFFRVGGECDFGDPFTPGGQSITKTFVVNDDDDDVLDDDDISVAGVNFSIVNAPGTAAFQRDGVSGTDGSRTFSNVPVGVYELFVNSVPAGFVLPTGVQDTIVVTAGADVSLVNELDFNQGFTKTVIVSGSDDDDDDTTTGVTLEGVNVTVYEDIGDDFLGLPVAGDVVFSGLTDEDGTVSDLLPVGDYILCISDANELAITENGETVIPDLTTSGGFGVADCEEFDLDAGFVTDLENEVDILEGVLNVFVFTEEPTDVGGVFAQEGVAGVEVCLDGPTSCATTNVNGQVRFLDITGGSHTIEVQGDGFIVLDADGGDLTVENETLVEDGASVTPAVITFDYDPTEDLVQDGWLDDDDDGTFDLEIEVEESTAPFIVKNVTLNGVAFEGATVTIVDEGGDGEIISADTETNADGQAFFVVESGTYTICSTIDIDTGQGQMFAYTICEADEVILDDFELNEFFNDHQTGTITKNVLVLDTCPVDVTDPLVDCTFVAAADGTEVTADTSLMTESDLFSGTYATVAGEVTLTLPISADVGNYEICSSVGNDDECETATIVAEANADLNNFHLVGQLDIGAGADFANLNFAATVCLYEENSDPAVNAPVTECVDLPENYLNAGVNGFFFANVVSGNYFTVFTRDFDGASFPSNVLAYSAGLDQRDGFNDDIENAADAAAGIGDLRVDGEFDWIFETDTQVTLGPGQTP